MPAYDAVLDFEPCRIGAHFTGAALTGLTYLPPDTPLVRDPHDHRVQHLANELERYTLHSDHVFDLLFVPRGTPFQLRVWHALLAIPAGHCLSYGALAARLNTAPRAVGQACASNPLPLVIPCHRVVSANGLGGFMHAASGAPVAIKAWLLRHERGNLDIGSSPCHHPLPSPQSSLPSPQPSPPCGRGGNRDAKPD